MHYTASGIITFIGGRLVHETARGCTEQHGQQNLKNVEFYSKNKFEKLVLLVGFIIRIYDEARSNPCHLIPFQHNCKS